MGSVTAYSTARGKRYKVQYRKPDHSSTSKRGFLTNREATLFLASIEVSTSRGAYVDPTRSRITVGDWMDQWMAARTDLRASTLERTEGILRRNIKPVIGNVALADLRRMMIQEWAPALSKNQSEASVRKIVNTLSGALQLAVDDGRIPTNPASGSSYRRSRRSPRGISTTSRYTTSRRQSTHGGAAAASSCSC